MKNLLVSIILVGFSSMAHAGNTIDMKKGCWVADAGGKTAHWVVPCWGASSKVDTPPTAMPTPNQPAALAGGSGDPLKGLNVSKGKGCWVPDGPNSNTAHWADPCPASP